jgi:lysophospholipase L1-like esterase/pimeloyl-ACP methyl ester carboxylesterase
MIKSLNILLISFSLHFFTVGSLFAQKDTAWDNPAKSKWDSTFHMVEMSSSIDGKIQKAYLYSSKSKTRKPLIVSLHTWSGDYTQKDPIATEILARDWNYIHPDFRGPNRTPESTGSQLVIGDIEDAIKFALKNTNSDPEDVHIVGVSGGGFATLAAYMNIRYPVKSFSAWASISDLEAWYWESVGRKQKYAGDIINALSTDSTFNREEALRRSPLMQKFPQDLRKNAKLYIYEGIHDGYEGSVPITHSINMYNRLVGELKYGFSCLDQIMPKAAIDSSLVSGKEIIDLLTKQINPKFNKKETLFGRNIYLSREFKNISLTIFEGGHEQLPQALGLIPYNKTTSQKYNILTIGDSNGQIKDGWVDQLKKMMPESHFVNISQSGRTIGFDNNGKKELNALTNIDNYMDEAMKEIGNKKYDFIILCLGTNDAKNEYAERQNEVVANFDSLLTKIVNHPLLKKSKTRLIYVTPPPIRTKDILAKYQGANVRIALLITQFTNIATKKGFNVIDIYHSLLGILDYYAADGVHMAGPGQEIIASKIIEVIMKNE